MPDNTGKTEKPTPKRIRDARKEGQFARTQDAPTWIAIAAAMAVFPISARIAMSQFRDLLAHLRQIGKNPDPAVALQVTAAIPEAVLRGALPMCLAAAAGGLLAVAAQGVHPSSKVLKPKFSRMSPKQGLKRMFGPKAAWEALKAFGKVAVIATVVVLIGRNLVPELLAGPTPLSGTIERTRKGLELIVWAAAVAGLLIALADYAYQKRTVMKQLMMTPREIKDEFKQSEGDPQVKSAIRQKQMAMSRNRMLANVATADVVMVNPTHIAIALKYEVGRGAPRVVAKGAGAVADKIRELAREHRVPVVEDKPLARALYRVCELEEEIPAELYTAVARILAFVMAAGKPGRRDRPRRGPSDIGPLPDLPTRAELRQRRAREVRVARNPGAAG